MSKDQYGVFEIVVPAKVNGQAAIPHNSKIKVRTARLLPSLKDRLLRNRRSPWSYQAESGSTGCRPGSST